MRLPLVIFWIAVVLLFGWNADTIGQVRAVGASKRIAYKSSIGDSVYFYSQVPSPRSGEFIAVSPSGGDATYEWSICVDSINYNVVRNDVNVPFSRFITSESNGYRVRITNTSGLDTIFYFWFFKNSVAFKPVKDDAGYVPFYNSFCDHVDLQYDSVKFTSQFRYFNTPLNVWDVLSNAISDTAWVSPASDIFVLKENIKNVVRITSPPIEESVFTLIVRDKFGAAASAEVQYKPIRVEAKMEKITITTQFDNLNKPDTEVDPTIVIDGTQEEYSPVTVEFTNQSKNAETFMWFMGEKDTIETKTIDEKVRKTYFLSGGTTSKTYTIWLVASNSLGCIDSVSTTVAVTEPKLTVPNVFTPGQTTNTYFLIKSASIKYFKIVIYSKWGKQVYKDEGPDIYNFKWDGYIGSTRAASGVYYYTLVYQTFDKTTTIDKNKVSHGFFYLFW